jgi:predicted signal transduction protein with EAL and GGDEF domain
MARLGGDEFVVLLDGLRHANDAMAVAQRLQEELTQPFALGGHDVFTSASVGIAVYQPSYTHPEELLRDADTALYRAKGEGRARSVVFDSEMHARAMARLRLENDLRKALDRHELRLQYQPIICLATGMIVGFEALVRWHHPERGVVSPGEFIPVAEETGLIGPIGQWVLRQACEHAATWPARAPGQAPPSVAVNLSRKQFVQTDLVEQVARLLRSTGVEARRLKLEVTEDAIMGNADTAIRMLSALRALHVDIHMDDFGTGYSSLSYLHRLPIDALKVDRSFVSNLGTTGANGAIFQAIVTLAHNLGLVVIAEGVATPEQLAQVLTLEADQAQGFHFARPVDASECARLIVSQAAWLQGPSAAQPPEASAA